MQWQFFLFIGRQNTGVFRHWATSPNHLWSKVITKGKTFAPNNSRSKNEQEKGTQLICKGDGEEMWEDRWGHLFVEMWGEMEETWKKILLGPQLKKHFWREVLHEKVGATLRGPHFNKMGRWRWKGHLDYGRSRSRKQEHTSPGPQVSSMSPDLCIFCWSKDLPRPVMG